MKVDYTMELPDDVLALIRAYAKPRFKYFREYNQAIRVLGKNHCFPLKESLQTHGDRIVPILASYVDAHHHTRLLKQHLFDFVNPLKNMPMRSTCNYVIERDRLWDLYRERKQTEDDLHWILVNEVYGIRVEDDSFYREQLFR